MVKITQNTLLRSFTFHGHVAVLHCCCCSDAKLCPTLCDSMDHNAHVSLLFYIGSRKNITFLQGSYLIVAFVTMVKPQISLNYIQKAHY